MINSCICTSTETNESFSIIVNEKQIKYHKCSNCLSYRMIDPPTKEEIISYYNKEKDIRLSDSFKTARINTAVKDVENLEVYLLNHQTTSKRLLDIGCSEGIFLQVANNRGFDAYGIDVATDLVAHGRKEGLNVEDIEYPDYKNGLFDVITFHDSLEHVYEPRLYLEKAFNDLNPLGLLQITFPSYVFSDNLSLWEHARLDHNWLFNIYGLTEILKEIGFKDFYVIDFEYGAYPSCVMIISHK